jgi:hypothetical protein
VTSKGAGPLYAGGWTARSEAAVQEERVRDEEYQTEQIPAYGESSQPAIAARMRPHLRMTQIGTAAALLALAACAVALVTYPRFHGADYSGGTAGRSWTVTALCCAAALLGICLFQLISWQRAVAVWSGARQADLRTTILTSWILHLASYVVLVLALWACIAGSGAAGWSATAAACLAVALALMIAAQVLAGVQYLRVSGPPGTIPAHMRRLIARDRLSRSR